jgi:tRNA(Arg) A34 adenosine deaminase TadA
MTMPPITIACPAWVDEVVDWEKGYQGDEELMRVAVALARENVLREKGGGFGALVVERESGRPVAAGVNLVLGTGNSVLHAEITAIMMAHVRLGSRDLGGHELVTSCEPCAMCLGATLWSGVSRLVTGATRDDATAAGFDEGPVFDASYAYLRDRGIEIARGILRAEASEVLKLYRERGGEVY